MKVPIIALALAVASCSASVKPLDVRCRGDMAQEGAVKFGVSGKAVPWTINLHIDPSIKRVDEYDETYGSSEVCGGYNKWVCDISVSPQQIEITRRHATGGVGQFHFVLDRTTGAATEMQENSHFPRVTEGSGPEYREHMTLNCRTREMSKPGVVEWSK